MLSRSKAKRKAHFEKTRTLLTEKIRESMISVLPIIAIVAVLCLFLVPMQPTLLLTFLVGALMIVVGLGLFSLGAERSMTIIGSKIGTALTKIGKLPVILLVACNLIDYATGLMASKYRAQDINSYKSIRGIFKKVSMWLLVVVGAIIDEMLLYASASIGWKSPVTFLVACVVAMWLICNEIISILENIQDMGVNIPAFMQPLVKHIRSQVEDQVKVDNDSEGE